MTTKPIPIVYVTASPFKQQENGILIASGTLGDGTRVADLAQFAIRQLTIHERLEIDIKDMVASEVREAYAQIKVPCIVEHAGLIFDGHVSYPGGLTKPMWNALGDKFVSETTSAGRKARAQAVVAYCDGQAVYTFVGERSGRIADAPRGSRKFYWDTIFIPEDPTHPDLTYAEIIDRAGLEHKVLKLSQSTLAIRRFLEHLRKAGNPTLWR